MFSFTCYFLLCAVLSVSWYSFALSAFLSYWAVKTSASETHIAALGWSMKWASTSRSANRTMHRRPVLLLYLTTYSDALKMPLWSIEECFSFHVFGFGYNTHILTFIEIKFRSMWFIGFSHQISDTASLSSSLLYIMIPCVSLLSYQPLQLFIHHVLHP